MENKWHIRYLKLAEHISSWSKDPSSQVGAVAIGEDGEVLSVGYNGLPRGIADTDKRLNNRELKYKIIVHAEMNVILNAARTQASLKGATLYVFGLPVCSNCAKGIVQSGISRVVIPYYTEIPERWTEEWELTTALFEECGIEIIFVDFK